MGWRLDKLEAARSDLRGSEAVSLASKDSFSVSECVGCPAHLACVFRKRTAVVVLDAVPRHKRLTDWETRRLVDFLTVPGSPGIESLLLWETSSPTTTVVSFSFLSTSPSEECACALLSSGELLVWSWGASIATWHLLGKVLLPAPRGPLLSAELCTTTDASISLILAPKGSSFARLVWSTQEDVMYESLLQIQPSDSDRPLELLGTNEILRFIPSHDKFLGSIATMQIGEFGVFVRTTARILLYHSWKSKNTDLVDTDSIFLFKNVDTNQILSLKLNGEIAVFDESTYLRSQKVRPRSLGFVPELKPIMEDLCSVFSALHFLGFVHQGDSSAHFVKVSSTKSEFEYHQRVLLPRGTVGSWSMGHGICGVFNSDSIYVLSMPSKSLELDGSAEVVSSFGLSASTFMCRKTVEIIKEASEAPQSESVAVSKKLKGMISYLQNPSLLVSLFAQNDTGSTSRSSYISEISKYLQGYDEKIEYGTVEPSLSLKISRIVQSFQSTSESVKDFDDLKSLLLFSSCSPSFNLFLTISKIILINPHFEDRFDVMTFNTKAIPVLLDSENSYFSLRQYCLLTDLYKPDTLWIFLQQIFENFSSVYIPMDFSVFIEFVLNSISINEEPSTSLTDNQVLSRSLLLSKLGRLSDGIEFCLLLERPQLIQALVEKTSTNLSSPNWIICFRKLLSYYMRSESCKIEIESLLPQISSYSMESLVTDVEIALKSMKKNLTYGKIKSLMIKHLENLKRLEEKMQ